MASPLSVLDLIPIASGSNARAAIESSLRLARRVEGLGYVRYWVAEHHNTSGLASASPEIMIALLARETQRADDRGELGADELMLSTHIGDAAERTRSYELVAAAMRE